MFHNVLQVFHDVLQVFQDVKQCFMMISELRNDGIGACTLQLQHWQMPIAAEIGDTAKGSVILLQGSATTLQK